MFLDKYRLDGKVAIITGGSRGIGRAIALGMAEVGADIVISARKLPDLEETAKEITALGRKCLPVISHIGKGEDRENLVKRTIEEFGRIDILVNNAGTNPVWGSVMEIDEKAWDKIMEVNLRGPFFLSQLVAKEMIKGGGGCIINIASHAGVMSYRNLGVYSISKAGLIMMTKVLAREWGKYNIRVNAVAPGLVRTRTSSIMWQDPKELNYYLEHTALGRIAEPEDIVGAVLLLASDASRHITGEVIIIGGGLFI